MIKHPPPPIEDAYCARCRIEAGRDLMMVAEIEVLFTIEAARELLDASTSVTREFIADRVPMTRAQTLAILRLANAAMHLGTLLP